METLLKFLGWHPRDILWICFPVGREWKQRVFREFCCELPTLDMLSRWKGMETRYPKVHRQQLYFGYAFPLEGNGNAIKRTSPFLMCVFGYAFPLEGNGNISPTLHTCYSPILWICFPVGREWKQIKVVAFYCLAGFFGYAFPLEGNGNFTSDVSIISMRLSLDMLSRWKGMETQPYT